jgi:hypothetical protein
MPTELKYGRYAIRTIETDKGWSGRAFRGGRVSGNIVSGNTEELTVLAVKAAIDAAKSNEISKRAESGFPTALEVREAINAIAITGNQRAMLNAHRAAPDRIMTATELAKAAGYANYSAANIQYGILGRKLAEELEWTPPAFGGVPIWTFALATGADGDTRAESEPIGLENWRWQLRSEVNDALTS